MVKIHSNNTWYKVEDKPTSDKELKFEVYQRYLENWVAEIKTQYSYDENLIKTIANETKSLQGNPKLDLDYIKRFLFIGWNSETLAELNGRYKNIHLLRISNQWKPIQIYYSVYSLAEAALYALDKKAGSHTSCLNNMSNFLVRTPIKPWNFGFSGYIGNSKTARTIQPVNLPRNVRIANPLELNPKPIESIGCCLQAEHRNRIEEYNPSRTGGPYKYLFNPGNTTILHFLYRLRKKTNYVDSEIFLAEASEDKIKAFSSNLSFICNFTNMIFEILIIRKIKKSVLMSIMNEFLHMNDFASKIKYRKKLYAKFI